jgi:CHAT domain-containing protein
VAVADPRPVSNARALPNALAEVAAIRKLFSQAQVLTGEQATRREVQETLAQASVVHFAGHGRNDWQSPLESGLLLAGDRLLTAQDLLDLRLEGARLATLSACETGIPGLELPDEVTGLPSACLLAGFAAVIASLWPVADISTALLMERFYRNWLVDQDDLAGALGNAQRWLRDLTAGELAAHFEGLMNLPQGEMPLPYQAIADYWTLFAGMQASARPFQHPFFWAAFSLYGT